MSAWTRGVRLSPHKHNLIILVLGLLRQPCIKVSHHIVL